MMRRVRPGLVTRDEICIFCASLPWEGLPTAKRAAITYRRQFQSSTTSFKPPTSAAAVAEEDEGESHPGSPTQLEIKSGQPDSVASSQSLSRGSWGAAGSTRTVAGAEGRAIPAWAAANRRKPDAGQTPSLETIKKASQPPSKEENNADNEGPQRAWRTVDFRGYHAVRAQFARNRNHSDQAEPTPASSEIPPPSPFSNRPGGTRGKYYPWRSFKPDSALNAYGDSRTSKEANILSRSEQLKDPWREEGPKVKYSPVHSSSPPHSDPSFGLENGWKHLRHTPTKRFRMAQEKREEQSKSAGWIGFSRTLDRPRRSQMEQGDESATSTTFRSTSENHSRLSEEQLRLDRRKARRGEKFIDRDDVVETEKSRHERRAGKRSKGRFAPRESDDEDEFDPEEFERQRAERRAKLRERGALKREMESNAPTPITLPEFISVVNLASLMKKRPETFLGKLEEFGFQDPTMDHILDAETAGLIAAEFNFEPTVQDTDAGDLVALPPVQDVSSLAPRPPIVTIMGHVDHGKTTILDYLRKSSVAASEFGGITQHIGAFSVPMPSGKLITFLDTPGHAAFLEMRKRGANITDIVILVVAADDSVKPQTVEAIRHIRDAHVATIVAINKVDKEDSDVERVKQDLAREGIAVEDYGGDIQAVPVSGRTGQGMTDLEEAAVALSEQLDMRADPTGSAEGWVIEATTKLSGRVATVLVRRGTLRPGHVIVAGTTWARVKTLKNEAGVEVDAATPGTPVEVDGWKRQPIAGDEVLQAPSEARAKSAIEIRVEKQEREQMLSDVSTINETRRIHDAEHERKLEEWRASERKRKIHDEGWQEQKKQSGITEIPFIAKADVSGSVEAVVNSISALGNAEVRANIIRYGVGPVSAFDVEHAAAAGGHILNFNTTVDPNIARMADMEDVEILNHNIIYRLVDAVKAKLSEELAPLITHRVTGEADVGQIFEISVKGRQKMSVAGCKVRNGTVTRNSKVRVLRNKEIIYDGTISSLKNVKKDVTEMRKGTECGMAFTDWQDFQVGDSVQCYDEISEKRSLD